VTPIIHTFFSETAPEGEQALAFFYEPRKKSCARLPMVFAAATEDAARIAAQAWWATERAKEDARRLHLEKITRSRLEPKP
jgi:predicted membrane-bound mannosyltransferase